MATNDTPRRRAQNKLRQIARTTIGNYLRNSYGSINLFEAPHTVVGLAVTFLTEGVRKGAEAGLAAGMPVQSVIRAAVAARRYRSVYGSLRERYRRLAA